MWNRGEMPTRLTRTNASNATSRLTGVKQDGIKKRQAVECVSHNLSQLVRSTKSYVAACGCQKETCNISHTTGSSVPTTATWNSTSHLSFNHWLFLMRSRSSSREPHGPRCSSPPRTPVYLGTNAVQSFVHFMEHANLQKAVRNGFLFVRQRRTTKS